MEKPKELQYRYEMIVNIVAEMVQNYITESSLSIDGENTADTIEHENNEVKFEKQVSHAA